MTTPMKVAAADAWSPSCLLCTNTAPIDHLDCLARQTKVLRCLVNMGYQPYAALTPLLYMQDAVHSTLLCTLHCSLHGLAV